MEEEKFRRAEFHYGIILLRTRRFQSLMDRLGANRVSKPIGWILLYLMPVAAFFGFYLFLSEAFILLSSRGAEAAAFVRTLGPLSYLGLPGINPYLPLVDGWLALVVAMIIHEGAHGIIARSLGLPVKASGLLFFLFVPIGAFVDVDETAIKQAKSSHSARVLAAGAGINLVVGVISLLLLISLVASMAPAANGVPISQVNLPSPADQAGIRPGDFILSVNGVHYNDASQIVSSSWYHPGQEVNVTIWSHGSVRVVPLTVGARPNATLSCDNPMVVGRGSVCILTLTGYLGTIAGDSVSFSSAGPGQFNSTSCTILENSCGIEYTPSSGSDSNQNITGVYRGDAYNLLTSATEQVEISTASASDQLRSSANSSAAQITPSELSRSPGYIGTDSMSYSSLSGLVAAYSSPLKNPWQYVCIPTLPRCQSVVPFSDALAIFYSSPLGPSTAPLANFLYWLFFLNFNLAIFNALPIYPLDGGQAFSVAVKALGKGKMSETTQMRVTSVATLAVLALLLGVIAAPYLFVLF